MAAPKRTCATAGCGRTGKVRGRVYRGLDENGRDVFEKPELGYFCTKKERDAAVSRRRFELEQEAEASRTRRDNPAAEITCAEYADEYIARMEDGRLRTKSDRTYKASSIGTARGQLKRFKADFGSRPLDSITRKEATDWAELHDRKQGVLQAVVTLFALAEDEELIDRARRVLCAVMAAVALTGALCGQAWAVSNLRVAVAPDGDAVFAWREQGFTAPSGITVRGRSAGGTLAAAQSVATSPVSCSSETNPTIDIDDAGNALVAWCESSAAMARRRGADGALGAPLTLSGPTVMSAPQVAVAPDGDAVFAWVRFANDRNTIQVRALSAAGILSPTQSLNAQAPGGQDPQIAIDDAGNAAVVWRRTDGVIVARRRTAGGLLGPTLILSGNLAALPQVAVAPDGDTVFAWARVIDGRSRRQVRALSAAGTLAATQTLDHNSQSGSAGPTIGIDDVGNALIAWWRNDTRIVARHRAADGSLGPTFGVSGEQTQVVAPPLDVAPDGDAIFAWTRELDTNTVWVRARSAPGTLSPARNLTPGTLGGTRPTIGIDAAGNALAAWEDYGGPRPAARLRRRAADGTLGPTQTLCEPC